MTTVEYSIEVDAPPELVWEVASDPRNLPHWDKHIVGVRLPAEGLGPSVRYDVTMSFLGVRTNVPCQVLAWDEPWHAEVHLGGLLDATVKTSIASLPQDRSMLRHEVRYVFNGPLGAFGAASVNAVGGAGYALRRGTLAQKAQIEERARSRNG